MKTYTTTKEHPDLKERIILTEIDNQYEFLLGYKTFYAGQPCIDSWLSNGFIEEVEELEFTKSDMIDLIKFDLNSVEWTPKQVFNDWKKQRSR